MGASIDELRLGALAAALVWRRESAQRLLMLHPDRARLALIVADRALPVAAALGGEVRDAGFPLPSWRNVPASGAVETACACEYYVARREMDSRRRARTEGGR